MKFDRLNTQIQLENDRLLLLPFDHQRNEQLKDIIFKHKSVEYMESGRIRLHETWERTSGDYSKGKSILEEI